MRAALPGYCPRYGNSPSVCNSTKVCNTVPVPCLQSQKLQGKSSMTRSGTPQTRAEACLDVLSRLDADLSMSAVHGALLATVLPPFLPPSPPLCPGSCPGKAGTGFAFSSCAAESTSVCKQPFNSRSCFRTSEAHSRIPTLVLNLIVRC